MEKLITVHVSGPKLLAVSLCSVLNTFPDIAAYEAAPQVTPKYTGDVTHEAVHVAVLPALIPTSATHKPARWGASAPSSATKRPLPAANFYPSRIVVIVHGTTEELMAASALCYRIFVSVHDDLRTIRQGVLAAARSGVYCSASLMPRMVEALSRRAQGEADADGLPREKLTVREREVAELAACGLSNAEIAENLGIKVPTAKAYLHSAFRKLHVIRRGQVGGALRA